MPVTCGRPVNDRLADLDANLTERQETLDLATMLGFGLMLVTTTHDLPDGLLQALSALFTVGAVHVGGRPETGIDVSVGAIWVVIVAPRSPLCPRLQLLQLARRIGLAARESCRPAGVGPGLLIRHQLLGVTETLPDLFAAWEKWAADVTESHTTYPIVNRVAQ